MRNLISVQQKLYSDQVRFDQLQANRQQQQHQLLGGVNPADPMTMAAAVGEVEGGDEMRHILQRLEEYDRELQKIQNEVEQRV